MRAKDYVPATVLVLDLVKHSTRPTDEVQVIQKILKACIQETMDQLELESTLFNFTGDGYIVTLMSSEAAQALDFARLLAGKLRSRLAAHDQQFRLGIDFGFIRPYSDELTSSKEFFDNPGIYASRLESAAQPDQILVSAKCAELFLPIDPSCVTGEPVEFNIKRHKLLAHELNLDRLDEIGSKLRAFLFAGPSIPYFS